MKIQTTAVKKLTAVLAAGILAAALAACGGSKTVYTSEPNDETGGFDVAAENASGAGVSGYFSVQEGECLVLSPVVDKGSFSIRVIPAGDFEGTIEGAEDGSLDEGFDDTGAVLEATLDSSVMSAYDMEPGEYYALVSVDQKTTGSLMVMPYSIEQLKSEDASLAEALAATGTGIEADLPSDALQDDTADDTESSAGDTASAEEDGQNPVMNFVGTYTWERCDVEVECAGTDEAKILVHWGSSAWESTNWTMQGKLDLETLTVEYSDCVKQDIVFSEDGESEEVTTQYENGTGRIIFDSEGPGTLTWEDDQEHAADEGVFTYSTWTPES